MEVYIFYQAQKEIQEHSFAFCEEQSFIHKECHLLRMPLKFLSSVTAGETYKSVGDPGKALGLQDVIVQMV